MNTKVYMNCSLRTKIDKNFVVLQAFDELKAVFTEHLAHTAYVIFYRILGETMMNEILKNHFLIRILCQEYEEGRNITSPSAGTYLETTKLQIKTSNIVLNFR